MPWILLTMLLPALWSAGAAGEDTAFRIAPHAGGRAFGSFEDSAGGRRDLEESGVVALALELRHGPDSWWQLWYSRQATRIPQPAGRLDVDVEVLHVGGTAPIAVHDRWRSFISGGLGATRLSPGRTGLDDETRGSVSLGVGLERPLGRRSALRLEARGYLALLGPDSATFCRTGAGDDACRILARGKTLFQAELLAGIAFGW